MSTSPAQPLAKRLGIREQFGLYSLELASFDAWPARIEGLSSEFIALIAADARDTSDALIMEAARRCLESGLRYLVAWGPDCERVHDLFDCVLIDEPLLESDSVVMTTWHADESLEEAIQFFLISARPTQDFERTCRARLAISIGSADWARAITTALA